MRAVAALVLASWLGVVTSASAHHADMVRSEPPNGARLPAAPAVVRAWFNQPLVVPGSGLAVTDASGRRLDDGNQSLDPGDPRALSVQLAATPPGPYTVTWRVTAESDLDYAQGTFAFAVDDPGLLERGRREGLLAVAIGLLALGTVRLASPAVDPA